MSGHSKWATIKHKKGATDAKRAKVFAKLIRQVEVAAREGGPDPEMNPSLRTMYQKARSASVPLDTIEKAIKRATGGLDGVNYEQITYEGYAAGGVALLIEVLTDNRNRSGSDVRSAFTKRSIERGVTAVGPHKVDPIRETTAGDAVLRQLLTIEAAAESAYLRFIAQIRTNDYLLSAGFIVVDEARHQTIWRRALGLSIY